MVSRTCRARDSRNPDLGDIGDCMIFENRGDLKEWAPVERVGQERQRA
jgi:hypothetical protein